MTAMDATRISPQDAAYLYQERPYVTRSIVSAYSFHEPEISNDDLVEWLAARAAGVRELRQRAVRAYGDIGDAYWSESPRFDARDHVEIKQVETWPALRELVASLLTAPTDTERPLWDLHIVRGVDYVPGGRGRQTVVVTRFHHAMADGLLATQIAKKLFSDNIQDKDSSTPATRAQITALEAVRISLRPFILARDLSKLTRMSKAMNRAKKSGKWPSPDSPARRVSFNGTCGPHRESAVFFIPADRLRRTARATGGVSANDLILTVIGRTLARHLDEGPTDLTTAIPLSVRSDTNADQRNAVSTAMISLHVSEPIVDSARAIHRQVASQRSMYKQAPFDRALSVLPHLPGFAYRLLSRRGASAGPDGPPLPTQLRVASTSKGSGDKWQLAGKPVIANFGFTSLSDDLGLSHCVYTIGDHCGIGVLADPDLFKGVSEYAVALQGEFEALIKSARD